MKQKNKLCSLSANKGVFMSLQDKKRERAMKMASAIGSIEGVPVSDKTKQLYLKWVNGELNEEQLMKELYQRHRKQLHET